VTRRDLFICKNVTEDGRRFSKVPLRRLSRGSTTNNATLPLCSNSLEQSCVIGQIHPIFVAKRPLSLDVTVRQQALGVTAAVNNERLANIGVERHADIAQTDAAD
jgi:hypothetical protein